MFLLRKLGISKRTAVSSARNVVKLTEGISEFGNFGPLKGIAIVLGQFIETIQEIENNDEDCKELIEHITKLFREINSYANNCEGRLDCGNFDTKRDELHKKIEMLHGEAVNIRKKKKPLFKRLLTRDDEVKRKVKDIGSTMMSDLESFMTWISLDTNQALHKLVNDSQPVAVDTNKTVHEVHHLLRSGQHGLLPARPANEDEKILEELKADYRDLREDEWEIERAKGGDGYFFTHEAEVLGQKRVVKRYDKSQQKQWLEDLKKYREIKDPNLPQMLGFSRRSRIIAFHNSQPRSVAAFVQDSLLKDGAVGFTRKMVGLCNQSLSAYRAISSLLDVSEATTAAVAKSAKYIFDSKDRLVVSLPENQHNLTLIANGGNFISATNRIWPPANSKLLNRYFMNLTLSGDGEGSRLSPPFDLSLELRKKIGYLSAHVVNDGTKFSLSQDKKGAFVMSTWIDPWSDESPGSYGYFKPGKQDEFAFESIGNARFDSPGLFHMEDNHTCILRFFEKQRKECVAINDDPKMWALNVNTPYLMSDCTLMRTSAHTNQVQKLTNISLIYDYLLHSIPWITTPSTSPSDIIFITEVQHKRHYGFDIDTHEDAKPFPIIFAEDPRSRAHELVFHQCDQEDFICQPACCKWDVRIKVGKRAWRDDKVIKYVQFQIKQPKNKPVSLSVIRSNLRRQAFQSVGPYIQSNRWWKYFQHREFELIIQRSSPLYTKLGHHEFETVDECSQTLDPSTLSGVQRLRKKWFSLRSR